jgi:hypothetical protein
MSVADEAELARDHLTLAGSVAGGEGRELTPAENAAVGQGYATLAVAEGIMHLATSCRLRVRSSWCRSSRTW